MQHRFAHFIHGGGFLLVKHLSQVGAHDHTVVGGNTEEGDEPHPHGHTQVDGVHLEQLPHVDPGHGKVEEPVLTVQPEHDEPAGESHEDTGEDHGGGEHVPELEKEDQEDHDQRDGYHQHKPFGGTYLVLIVAGEDIVHAGGHDELPVVDLFLQEGLGIFHDIHLGKAFFLVEDDISHQEGVFALDELGSAGVGYFRQFAQRHLHAGRGGDEDLLQIVGVVTVFPGIAHPHGEALPSFDGVGEGHAADGAAQEALQIFDRKTVAREGPPVDLQLQVGLAHHPVGEDRGGLYPRHLLEEPFDIVSGFFNGFQIGTVYLDAHGGTHTGLQHDQTGLDGLQLG